MMGSTDPCPCDDVSIYPPHEPKNQAQVGPIGIEGESFPIILWKICQVIGQMVCFEGVSKIKGSLYLR